MTKKPKPVDDRVRAMIADAERAGAALRGGVDDPPDDDGAGEPRADMDMGLDADDVQWCAGLDHSDTDNAKRLIRHFGDDLVVLAQEKAKQPVWGVWTGSHWDLALGAPAALRLAQRIGGAVALETVFIGYTPDEERAIASARSAGLFDKDKSKLTPEDSDLLAAAAKAKDSRSKRIDRRHAHAVSSKNNARLNAMLACAAPHVLRSPDDFNADPLKLATRTHTLSFAVSHERRPNPDFADPDVSAEDVPEFVETKRVTFAAQKGHDRSDWITQVIQADYDEGARCPKWRAFIAEVLPDAQVAALVQQAAGLGLLGVTVQKLFSHYGKGANGKSVFLEVVCRVLGEWSVTLPADSFFGESRGAGASTPDLARLYGRRLLRVKELPAGEPLRENLVKELTGGEAVAVRNNFEGYFDFKPIFVAHMSFNERPEIPGTDNGIWRRIVVVPWLVTIPVERQIDFEEFVSSFDAERSGILNWLIDGARSFLENGLLIPDSVAAETAAYRKEMDRTAGFCEQCVRADPDGKVRARALYEAYVNWAVDNGETAIKETRFGKVMAGKYSRVDGRDGRSYRGIALVNLPPPPVTGANDYAAHAR